MGKTNEKKECPICKSVGRKPTPDEKLLGGYENVRYCEQCRDFYSTKSTNITQK